MSTLGFGAAAVRHNIELLQGLSNREVDSILAVAKPLRRSAKSVITHQGEPADHLYLLWSGRGRYFFETSNGRKLILRWITPGDILGGAALVHRPSTYIVSTEVVRDSVLLEWDGRAIRDIATRFPRIFENVIFLAADYISWYVTAHAALASQTAVERLAHVLVELSSRIGDRVAGGVQLDVTNEELANSANITPHTASRIISAWQKSGVVHKHRGKLIVRFPNRLFVPFVLKLPADKNPFPKALTNSLNFG
jgi:CRP-like cAMP-binding protein